MLLSDVCSNEGDCLNSPAVIQYRANGVQENLTETLLLVCHCFCSGCYLVDTTPSLLNDIGRNDIIYAATFQLGTRFAKPMAEHTVCEDYLPLHVEEIH